MGLPILLNPRPHTGCAVERELLPPAAPTTAAQPSPSLSQGTTRLHLPPPARASPVQQIPHDLPGPQLPAQPVEAGARSLRTGPWAPGGQGRAWELALHSSEAPGWSVGTCAAEPGWGWRGARGLGPVSPDARQGMARTSVHSSGAGQAGRQAGARRAEGSGAGPRTSPLHAPGAGRWSRRRVAALARRLGRGELQDTRGARSRC